MALTPTQITTLRNAVLAEATLSAARASGDDIAIAAWLNALAAGPFIVWRTDIKSQEIINAVVGSEFAALTAIKQNLLTVLLSPGVVDGSAPNVQADFSAIFSAGATLTALAALAKRSATNAEKLLATGTGSTGSPATMALVGPVTDRIADMR